MRGAKEKKADLQGIPIPALCSMRAPTLPGEVVDSSLLPRMPEAHIQTHQRICWDPICCICLGQAGPGSSARDRRLNATFLEHGAVHLPIHCAKITNSWECVNSKRQRLSRVRETSFLDTREKSGVMMSACINAVRAEPQKVNQVCTELIASALKNVELWATLKNCYWIFEVGSFSET